MRFLRLKRSSTWLEFVHYDVVAVCCVSPLLPTRQSSFFFLAVLVLSLFVAVHFHNWNFYHAADWRLDSASTFSSNLVTNYTETALTSVGLGRRSCGGSLVFKRGKRKDHLGIISMFFMNFVYIDQFYGTKLEYSATSTCPRYMQCIKPSIKFGFFSSWPQSSPRVHVVLTLTWRSTDWKNLWFLLSDGGQNSQSSFFTARPKPARGFSSLI